MRQGSPLSLLRLSCSSFVLSCASKCSGDHLLICFIITLICASSRQHLFDQQDLPAHSRHCYKCKAVGLGELSDCCDWHYRKRAVENFSPGTKLLMHSCTVLHISSSCPLSGSCDLHCSGCFLCMSITRGTHKLRALSKQQHEQMYATAPGLTRRSALLSHISAQTCGARPALRMWPALGTAPARALAPIWEYCRRPPV